MAMKFSCEASGLELTNQSESPGCSNFDVRKQCSNKIELMLTIKIEADLNNSKVSNGKQILRLPTIQTRPKHKKILIEQSLF